MWKINLSLQEAKLPVLLEEELVGVCRHDSPHLITALIHTGGTGKPGGRCRVCCRWTGGEVRGGVTTPGDSGRNAEGTGRSRKEGGGRRRRNVVVAGE